MSGSPRRRWVLTLFALPFCGVGVWLLGFVAAPWLAEGVAARDWQLGEARLTGAGVRATASDHTTTYRAWATYAYEYEGRDYRGDRVALEDSADNIGDFQQRLGRRLERAFESGEPVPVWIDPDDPSQAVLNRDLRWGKLAMLLGLGIGFAGAGCAMLWFALRRRRSAVTGDALAAKPWLARKEWASPEIASGAKSTLVVAWIFAAFWNAVSIPVLMAALRGWQEGSEKAALGFLFPAIGLCLLVWALRTTVSWRRFGRTTLRLDPYPGAIGGQCGGTLELGVPYDASHRFRVSLCCLKSQMTGAGKNRRRSENVVWQADGYGHTVPGVSGTRLEILFDVDDGLPASEPQDQSTYHLWRLHIEAALPGIDFTRDFEIPVFPTAEHARALVRLSTEHPAAEEERAHAMERVMELRELPDGVELHWPAFRNPGGKLVGALVGALFVAVCYFTAGTDAPLPLRVVFGAAGGLLVLGSLYSLLVTLDVRIDHAALETRKRLLGLPAGGRRLPRGEVRGLALKRSYSWSTGGRHTVYFNLQALPDSGAPVTIGRGLAGRQTAREAMEAVSRRTGLPVAAALEENALA